MNVKQLIGQLAALDDETPVLIANHGSETNELVAASPDRMCEWTQQKMMDVCVLSCRPLSATWSERHNRKGRKGNVVEVGGAGHRGKESVSSEKIHGVTHRGTDGETIW